MQDEKSRCHPVRSGITPLYIHQNSIKKEVSPSLVLERNGLFLRDNLDAWCLPEPGRPARPNFTPTNQPSMPLLRTTYFSASLTCTARGPFGEGSDREKTRNPWQGLWRPTKAEIWKKTRGWDSLLMNPNPRDSLYDSITPS